jgi:hypothetical protein
MKKKILIFSIITVFMLVAISFATAVNTEKTTKKASPLFGIRTRRTIGREKINEIKENIRSRFIGERVFFLPFQWLNNKDVLITRQQLGLKTINCYTTEPNTYKCTYCVTNCHPCK